MTPDELTTVTTSWWRKIKNVFQPIGATECTSAYGRRNEFRRNPPLLRSDREEAPFARHALELIPARRVSRSLHKCRLDAAELEKMQSNLRTYTSFVGSRLR